MKKVAKLSLLTAGISLACVLPVQGATSTQNNGSSISMEPLTVVTGVAQAELMLGVETWSGDNTYQIGHPVKWANGTVQTGYFPFSELSFPLDFAMATLRTNVIFHDVWMVSASVKKDVSDPKDDMIDKDWITDSNPNQLDIYSNSTITEFEAYEFDIAVKYKFLQGDKWSLNAGLGYMYQNWQYTAALIEQYSPSGYDQYYYKGDGATPGIRYKLEYNVPYVQIGGKLNLDKRFSLISNLSYSPFLDADNFDQHLMRDKVNRGELQGYMWMFNLQAQLNFTTHLFMQASYDFKRMKSDGNMSAEFPWYYALYYGESPNHTVWQEVDTTQHAFGLNFGYHF